MIKSTIKFGTPDGNRTRLSNIAYRLKVCCPAFRHLVYKTGESARSQTLAERVGTASAIVTLQTHKKLVSPVGFELTKSWSQTKCNRPDYAKER
jgi:hypothetical protein